MNYKLVTNSDEIKIMLDDFFFEILIRKEAVFRLLENFGKKEGLGFGGKTVLFLNDLDESDEAYQKLGNDRVLLSVDEATSTADEDSEAYLSFPVLYEHLSEKVAKIIEDRPEEKGRLEDLMSKVRKALDI